MSIKKWVALILATAVLMSALCFSGIAEDGETDAGDGTEIDEVLLKKLMMADRFVFRLPEEGAENLLAEPVVQKGVFSSLTNQTRMQVLYNEGGKIDALDTAYLTYRLQNNSTDVLSLGTMVYFRTTGGNLCAYVLKPLVYDAKTGKKLDLRTSYEYTGGKYVLTDIMPTVEIPPESDVFIAIPFTSTDDITNSVPGLTLADEESFVRGREPGQGVLWSNNPERTELMKAKLERDGGTDCLQMQMFLGGNGTDPGGNRRYQGNFDFEISELYAISKSEYFEYASKAEPPTDDGEDEPEMDEKELGRLMMADNFVFGLPDDNNQNLLDQAVIQKGIFSSLNNQTRMQVVYHKNSVIDALDTAYLAYKLTNNSNEILSIGTMVYFSTTGGNLCALVLNPMVYDAKTGKKLKLKTSYEYSSGKYVLGGTMPTVEIPAFSEVYMVIPFVSVADGTNYVPGLVMADGESYTAGAEPKSGVLWSNNAERTQLMENKLKIAGTTDCMQMQIFLGGNGSDANGARSYQGNFDFEISRLYAVSKADYYAFAKDYSGDVSGEEKPPIGEDEDGNKYTTITLTDSGLAMAPSFDVNGNIRSVAFTRDEFASIARTFKADGFNRVYVVTTRTGIPAASSASNQWNDPGDTPYKISDSVILSGDPNFELVYACKREGLEVIAVFKPYEGGGASMGTDADMSNTLYYEETVGGYWTGYDAFISAHPEMRLSRKENEEEKARVNDTVTRIEAAFILDDFSYHAWTGGLRRVSIAAANTSDIKLYVSKNNTDYVEYDGYYELSFKAAKKTYLDENGWLLYDKGSKCLVVTFSELEIGSEYKYMALVMEDNTDRYIIPQSMIKIFNADGEEIPSTVAPHVRYVKNTPVRPEGYKWGAEDVLRGYDKTALDYFESWGFEFDLEGYGMNNDSAFVNSYVYGIARGNFEYAKGTLCEAYDEVREYWLSEVKNLLNMGYDGIEIRLQAHSSMISDYAYYGFNEPMMQAYIEKYGTDPRDEATVSKETAYRIALLRGEFFMDFITEAEKLVHGAGKTFGFHMRSAMLDSSMDGAMKTSLHQMFCWAMPKIIIDWKQAVDLVDTVTIKQNFSNNYRPEMIAELTAYAKERDVQVWITAYTQQYTNVDEYGVQIGEANVGYFDQIAKDPNVYGVQIYEWDPNGGRFQHAFGILKKALNYIPRRVD